MLALKIVETGEKSVPAVVRRHSKQAESRDGAGASLHQRGSSLQVTVEDRFRITLMSLIWSTGPAPGQVPGTGVSLFR